MFPQSTLKSEVAVRKSARRHARRLDVWIARSSEDSSARQVEKLFFFLPLGNH
jgi:hypothetical protein